MEFASPPRWRAWATGDPVSPRRDSSQEEFIPPSYFEGDDRNQYAVSVMEKGFEHFRMVLHSTDPTGWAWSKPLWQALFQTSYALSDPVSDWATETIYHGFRNVANQIPCQMCASHFIERLSSFPRRGMNPSNLQGWVSELKKEVDFRAQQRRDGVNMSPQHQSPHQSPRHMSQRPLSPERSHSRGQVAMVYDNSSTVYLNQPHNPTDGYQPHYNNVTRSSSPRTPWAELAVCDFFVLL